LGQRDGYWIKAEREGVLKQKGVKCNQGMGGTDAAKTQDVKTLYWQQDPEWKLDKL